VVAVVWLALSASVVVAETDVDGHWKGKIDVPGGALEIDVDLERAADGVLSGDISIPVQGIRDMALDGLSLEGSSIRFRMPGIPGSPSFDGTVAEAGDRISGAFTQGGAELTFDLARGDRPAEAARVDLEGLGDVARKAIADFNVPGLAIAVIAGGDVVYAEGFGRRDLEKGLPMTPDSLFAIGSTTKAMTATVLGMLADEGKLDWDQPLRTYLPGFRLSDAVVSERITPRDLVTHRSGMPRHDLLWYNNNGPSRAEIIGRLAHLELTEDLRAKYQYNNLMFMTAGYLAGQLSGGTWEEAMRGRLFGPLGMDRSNFSVADSQRDPDCALPYRENDEDALERIPFRAIDLVGPAGSVNSSVKEMTRWLLFNLRGGQVGETRLINASSLAEIHSAQMTTGATPERPDISAATYGMGWVVDTYRGHRRLAHGGGIDGFITSVMLFPDDDLGLVSFTNVGSGLPSLLSQHAADRILGLEQVDWIGEALGRRQKGKAAAKEAAKKKEATRVADTRPSHPLEDYVGVYEHPGYGRLEVTRSEAVLTAHFNGIAAPLEHWHYDVWSGAETEGDPTFENLKFLFRGNVDGLVASVESTLEPTASPIVFEKRPDPRLSDPDYLSRFVATYQTATGTRIRIELSGDALVASIPGQPSRTLVPDLSGRFVLKEVRVVSVGFEADAQGKVTKAVFYQPDGVFEAPLVEN
jgi:CubicO group peptidase (beta-lactamase class C family)